MSKSQGRPKSLNFNEMSKEGVIQYIELMSDLKNIYIDRQK
ncbi:hypothetical protein [Spiroplasma endosymbiont of Polydrusus formosus]